MAQEIGQRIPIPATHPAHSFGYQSRQRVLSPEAAIFLVLIDSVRHGSNLSNWNEIVDVFSTLLRCDLRRMDEQGWNRVYWSKDFVKVLKELRELVNFQILANALPVFVISEHMYEEIQYPAVSEGTLGVEVCSEGDAFALYWSPASEERVPLDCQDLVTVSGLQIQLPRRFTNRDLSTSINCPTCWKQTTLARALRILNRLDYVKMLKQCCICEARATIELACGCCFCEEHWGQGLEFLGFSVECRTHGRLDLTDSQIMWATFNSLKSRDDDFQRFPLGYTDLYCKNQHVGKVKATVILHELCHLCLPCYDFACASLQEAHDQQQAYICPLCCSTVHKCDGTSLTQYYQDTGRVCSICQQPTVWLRRLGKCGHLVCVSCLQTIGNECGCVGKDGKICGVELEEDDKCSMLKN